MANPVRQFEPPNAFTNPDGTLTDRAQWFLRNLFTFVGASTGQIPTGSLGGDGVSTDTFLREDGSFAVPDYPSGANPSATVGEAAVNGSANTFMRSDAAPAIDLAMSPDWVGAHNFGAGLTGTTCALSAGFGCNGKTAQASASVPAAVSGTAGATYTATEQAMLNDLKAMVNAVRTALINNGTAV